MGLFIIVFQELDIAIVRATNHVERPAKEKHIRGLFSPSPYDCFSTTCFMFLLFVTCL